MNGVWLGMVVCFDTRWPKVKKMLIWSFSWLCQWPLAPGTLQERRGRGGSQEILLCSRLKQIAFFSHPVRLGLLYWKYSLTLPNTVTLFIEDGPVYLSIWSRAILKQTYICLALQIVNNIICVGKCSLDLIETDWKEFGPQGTNNVELNWIELNNWIHP